MSRKYKLPASCIIPLTKRSEVASAPDFPVGSPVLAVYPGTTALYKAAVVGPQRKVKTFCVTRNKVTCFDRERIYIRCSKHLHLNTKRTDLSNFYDYSSFSKYGYLFSVRCRLMWLRWNAPEQKRSDE